ncbi:MAG: hypothetical protein LBI84_02890 [Propionibacteriaceae bacterium]|nr:hypothetical protein [Propionibacteriaceae bacterium]
MRGAAEAGDENFARHIVEGHLSLYLNDIAYITSHGSLIDRIVVGL